jgi:hypothetical protein
VKKPRLFIESGRTFQFRALHHAVTQTAGIRGMLAFS